MRVALFCLLLFLSIPARAEKREKHPNLMSLEFQDTDVRVAMRVLAEMKQLSVVIAPGVSGTVSVSLKEVTWRTALDVISRLEGLRYQIEPPVLYVVPLKP